MLYKHYFIESLEQLHEAGVVAPFYRVKSSDCKVPALNHYTTKHQQKKPQSLLFSLTYLELVDPRALNYVLIFGKKSYYIISAYYLAHLKSFKNISSCF